tara:strand:+ start:187 stop:513 length:327 start_codon:yes stop_codon:yes gene_type:complete
MPLFRASQIHPDPEITTEEQENKITKAYQETTGKQYDPDEHNEMLKAMAKRMTAMEERMKRDGYGVSGGKTRRRSSARKHNKSKKHHKKSKKHHKKHHNKKSKKHRKK